MAVWYLDDEDEITDAVARLRSTTDSRVVFVVPSGSRIATGRINFRLLAREASARDLELAIASPDEQVRSLAISAGVLGLATAEQAEAALQRGDDVAALAESITPSMAAETGAAATSEAAAADSGRRRTRLSLGVILVVVLLVVASVAALQVLPTATITLAPRLSTLGPMEVSVTALTTVDEPDIAAREVPAVTVPIPLQVEGVFAASGRESTSSQATGEVVFSSADQSFDQEIVAGTRVLTPAGEAFQTTAAVTLARPLTGSGPAQVSAPVEAVDAGPSGNVPAGAISVVPSLSSQGISVTNPEPTSGGDRVDTPIVTRQDYDAAAIDLQNRLAGAMAARLRDPAIVPAGLTLFAETAHLGSVDHQPPADQIVGQSLAEFTLTSTAAAQVLAVDRTDVEAVARAALLASVTNDMTLQPGSVRIDVGEGIATGQRIGFTAEASADVHPRIDPDALRAEVAGLPISDAQAILGRLGKATVTVWPDFVGGLPNDGDRISLDIQEPTRSE